MSDVQGSRSYRADTMEGRDSGLGGPDLVFDHFEAPTADSVTPSDLVACFTAGTSIATPGRTQNRSKRSTSAKLVRSRKNHGFQPLRWIGATTRKVVGRDPSRPNPPWRPRPGGGLPRRDLLVSPQHGMLVRSGHALEVIGRSEVLLPAEKLIGLPGVDWARDAEEVTYLHLLFDAHEIVFAERHAHRSRCCRGRISLAVSAPRPRRNWAFCFHRAGTDRRAARGGRSRMTPLRPGWPTATCAAPVPILAG